MSRLEEAAERVREVGELLVKRAELEPGMEVLDVGTGTGNAALPAAKAGTRVTGLDRSEELLAIARERGADEMLELDWVEGGVEKLPFEDGRFDRVLSAFGHMFAAHHDQVARELERVCSGRLVLAAWTPDGLGGQTLGALARHLPPPPEYSSPPALWGDEEHVRELLGPGADCERHSVELGAESPEQWVEFVGQSAEPFIQGAVGLEEDALRSLSEELLELFRGANTGGGSGFRVEQEYLLTIVNL